jgi:MFS transporter, FHS family, glucose/mannose:H+ symporter
MPITDTQAARGSARLLTYGAYASFVPIGIATVLLGPLLPTLSAQWSLNYAQAGALFTVQYVASTCAVAFSGVLASRRGFLSPIKAGLILMSLGLTFLSTGPEKVGIACIALYGAGLGVAVPAANLMVAAANPSRRSATLNLLNFFWSVGAVACPFLVAAAIKMNRVSLFLGGVAACSLLIVAGIRSFPSGTVQSGAIADAGPVLPLIRANVFAFLIVGCLFFFYVGTENAFGGWLASYSKTLRGMTPSFAVMTPSFFYASLMVGRWVVPFLLHWISDIRIAQSGLLLAFLGSSFLIVSHGSIGVVASACAAGFGLSSVYPITISLLSRQFESARIGSIMFTLSNIGGGLFPWTVGIASDHFGAIKVGLFIPLFGCALMFVLFLRAAPQSELHG